MTGRLKLPALGNSQKKNQTNLQFGGRFYLFISFLFEKLNVADWDSTGRQSDTGVKYKIQSSPKVTVYKQWIIWILHTHQRQAVKTHAGMDFSYWERERGRAKENKREKEKKTGGRKRERDSGRHRKEEERARGRRSEAMLACRRTLAALCSAP